MKSLVIMFVAFLAIPSAFAGSQANGVIKAISMDRIYSQHKVFITIAGAKTEFPDCHTNTSWTYVMPLETNLDMAIFSAILSAQKDGKPIIAEGRGECSVHSSIETLEYIKLQSP